MSQPERVAGVDELRNRRERNRRQPPPPRHPKADPEQAVDVAEVEAADTGEIAREIPREVAPETVRADPVDVAGPEAVAPVRLEPQRAPVAAAPAVSARRVAGKSAAGPQPLPNLDVDLTDPAAMMVTPTVLSIPGPIMLRFEAARPGATSHTALVLNALRAHAQQLPALVLASRPGPRPGDLFPYRSEPGESSSARPAPLRIRPTAGELSIMDAISEWVNGEIHRQRPGGRKVSRSEVVAVALDKFLPRASGRRGSQ